MLLSEPCALKQGNLLTTFKKVHEEYFVQFDLFPLEHPRSFFNIVHFTTGGNYGPLGTRIPGVWMNDVLYFSSGINDKGDFGTYGDNTKIPLRQWAKIEIAQKKYGAGIYIYSIVINSRPIFQVMNSKPRFFNDVKLYVADGWFPAHKGYIRNLYVEGYELNATSEF